jgi:hypothetical protein
VLDRKGERFAEVYEENQRRVWVFAYGGLLPKSDGFLPTASAKRAS